MPLRKTQSATGILTGVVQSLVSRPELVSVDANYAADCVAFTVVVAPEDLDAVVGERGRTSRSLRTIVAALSKRSDLIVSLDIKATDF